MKILLDRSCGIVGSDIIAVTIELRAASSPTQVKIRSDWFTASVRVGTAFALVSFEAWAVARAAVRL